MKERTAYDGVHFTVVMVAIGAAFVSLFFDRARSTEIMLLTVILLGVQWLMMDAWRRG